MVLAQGVELPEKFSDPTWAFFESANGEPGKQVGTEYHANMKGNIAKPGNYIVRISEGNATIEVPFKVEANKVTKIEASFEAGVIKFMGFMDEATPIAEDNTNAAWELFGENNQRLGTEYGGQKMFMSNAGKHKVELTLGDAHAEQDVEFVAGKINEQKVTLGAGVIEVTAVFSEGGKTVPEGASFELHKGEPDLDGKYERLTTDYKSPSRFSAAAGPYQIVVVKDYATATAKIDLKSGAREKLIVNLNAGYLALKTAGAKTYEVYTIEKNLDGKRERLATEYGDELNKAFNAGNYHVVVSADGDVIIGEKDFEVKAGVRTEGVLP